MIGLVKYKCGCIGFPPHVDDVVLVKCCDADIQDDDINLRCASPSRVEKLKREGFTPLEDGGQAEFVNEIGNLIHAGYKFRSIRSLLGWIK